jgi:hypothetical protein
MPLEGFFNDFTFCMSLSKAVTVGPTRKDDKGSLNQNTIAIIIIERLQEYCNPFYFWPIKKMQELA